MISIDEMLKFTKGQGHKVKGQDQMCKFVKNVFRPYSINQLFDIDHMYKDHQDRFIRS